MIGQSIPNIKENLKKEKELIGKITQIRIQKL